MDLSGVMLSVQCSFDPKNLATTNDAAIPQRKESNYLEGTCFLAATMLVNYGFRNHICRQDMFADIQIMIITKINNLDKEHPTIRRQN